VSDGPGSVEDGSRVAPEPEALRERAATGLERALGFVQAQGDEFARLRAAVAVQAETAETAVAAIAARQRGDGSFPRLGESLAEALGYRRRQTDAVSGCLDALGALTDLNALHHPCAERATRFLEIVQNGDGSWGDPALAADERLFETGALAGTLGRTRFARPAALGAAGDFLGSRWPQRQAEWPAIAGFAQFFANVHHELADQALQWCGRELERGLREGRIEAVAALRVLLDCEAAALPGFGVPPMELLDSLLGQQARDGGFAPLASGGGGSRVAPTLDAMIGLVRLCAAF
jgi:hypothetical protein